MKLNCKYIQVLKKDLLYPFENSIRTERGYWVDNGQYFEFKDMEVYWNLLFYYVDKTHTNIIYEQWQSLLEDFRISINKPKLNRKIIYDLTWLLVYFESIGSEFILISTIDQKAYKSGYSVPYVRLIDQFISQEETVFKRWRFKNHIKEIVEKILITSKLDNVLFTKLITYYNQFKHEIDFEGLKFIFDIHESGI